MIFRTLEKYVFMRALSGVEKGTITNQQRGSCYVTRQEVLLMLVRALQLSNISTEIPPQVNILDLPNDQAMKRVAAVIKNGSGAKYGDRIYLENGKVRIDKTKDSAKMVDEFLRKS